MYGPPYGSQPSQSYPSSEYSQQAQPSGGHASRQRTQRDSQSDSRKIGNPLSFSTGQFAGQLMRAELVELQKADLGRKYARKDRRPLDPPPVVQLRLYSVHNAGTDQQTETEVEHYDEINNMGLICHVDLFPVPAQDSPEASTSEGKRKDSTTASPSHASTHIPTPTPAPQPPYPGAVPGTSTIVPGHPSMHLPSSQYGQDPAHMQGQAMADNEVVHHFNNYAITESSKCTESLAGTTFVQASNLDYKGNKVLMFVFSVAGEVRETPVWAECYGGPFRVYSTKEFPGLRASTDLTKHLSYFGVRLNLRETERKRRKKTEIEDAASGGEPGAGRRRRRAGEDEEMGEATGDFRSDRFDE
ncbi:hypothetical protein EVG20_g6625 [Dentipellis fragilis]|uniref:Velvet domain-containing protein n=1 Tax=Dentipellis fragilis TaxID=205917 RepID=A0A4Y9YME6_9AGAM|nr:hypothetical protein EVG20_g6625 [Dentipellis fragilis]